MICNQCGLELQQTAVLCPKCGTPAPRIVAGFEYTLEVKEALSIMVDTHGCDVLCDTKKLIAFLNDYLPEYEKERRLIRNVVNNDVIKNMLREENHTIAEWCRKRKILVNVVDDQEYCDFIFPSLIAHGNLSIGICTNGASPATGVLLKRKLWRTEMRSSLICLICSLSFCFNALAQDVRLCGKFEQGELLFGTAKNAVGVVFNGTDFSVNDKGEFLIAVARDEKTNSVLEVVYQNNVSLQRLIVS